MARHGVLWPRCGPLGAQEPVDPDSERRPSDAARPPPVSRPRALGFRTDPLGRPIALGDGRVKAWKTPVTMKSRSARVIGVPNRNAAVGSIVFPGMRSG
jgi:hypothetical protein